MDRWCHRCNDISVVWGLVTNTKYIWIVHGLPVGACDVMLFVVGGRGTFRKAVESDSTKGWKVHAKSGAKRQQTKKKKRKVRSDVIAASTQAAPILVGFPVKSGWMSDEKKEMFRKKLNKPSPEQKPKIGVRRERKPGCAPCKHIHNKN